MTDHTTVNVYNTADDDTLTRLHDLLDTLEQRGAVRVQPPGDLDPWEIRADYLSDLPCNRPIRVLRLTDVRTLLGARPLTPGPRRYTLEEAARILCADWGGHDISTTTIRTGAVVQEALRCTRCDTTFVPQEPTP